MSVKQVISLMATTPGADEFNTGVEYGVARESSCQCQFSAISLFWERVKLFHILDAFDSYQRKPLGVLFHVNRSSVCTCQLAVMTLCDVFSSLFPLASIGTWTLWQFLSSVHQLFEGQDAHRLGHRRQRRRIKIRQWRNYKIIGASRSGRSPFLFWPFTSSFGSLSLPRCYLHMIKAFKFHRIENFWIMWPIIASLRFDPGTDPRRLARESIAINLTCFLSILI